MALTPLTIRYTDTCGARATSLHLRQHNSYFLSEVLLADSVSIHIHCSSSVIEDFTV